MDSNAIPSAATVNDQKMIFIDRLSEIAAILYLTEINKIENIQLAICHAT